MKLTTTIVRDALKEDGTLDFQETTTLELHSEHDEPELWERAVHNSAFAYLIEGEVPERDQEPGGDG